MGKTARWALGIAAVLVVGAVLVGGGLYFGGLWGGWGYGPSMMGYWSGSTQPNATGPYGYGPMGSMMGGRYNNMMGGGYGMMGGTGNSALYGVQPLSIPAAQTAVETYLSALRNGDLTVGEVLIFDNQAYARIDEKSTGRGAMEVLVDPVTLAVSPEPGANMMWTLKYGMMAGFGGGMMGGYYGGATRANPNDPMPVTPDQAVTTAQRYLDTYLPGAKAETQPDTFYGYYTLEILRNGQMAGMLSVNGYTRQVILHTWHGRFIESSAK